MKISVIIPTFNEEANIAMLIELLKNSGGDSLSEIIVSDGGSSDKTVFQAERAGAITVESNVKCRACQMNLAAKMANGDILYFVHADTRPPESFAQDILEVVQKGADAGCYRFQFDSKKFLLKINSYFTRFDRMMFRGGDQTLFVTREVFDNVGGYDENFRVMEEYDFIKRVRKNYSFKIIPKSVLVSARKYDSNSWLKVNIANFIAFMMYRCGCSQDRMIKTYYRLLKQPSYNPEA